MVIIVCFFMIVFFWIILIWRCLVFIVLWLLKRCFFGLNDFYVVLIMLRVFQRFEFKYIVILRFYWYEF